MKRMLMLGAFAPVLFLSACGEGWEMRAYHNVPYAEDRTAGSGVEYVRAHMMSEKGPSVQVQEQQAAPAPEIVPEPVAEPVKEEEKKDVDSLVNSGEKFFRDLQKK